MSTSLQWKQQRLGFASSYRKQQLQTLALQPAVEESPAWFCSHLLAVIQLVLQGVGSKIRQEIPHTVGCKARVCNCCFDKKRRIPAAAASTEVKWTSIKKL